MLFEYFVWSCGCVHVHTCLCSVCECLCHPKSLKMKTVGVWSRFTTKFTWTSNHTNDRISYVANTLFHIYDFLREVFRFCIEIFILIFNSCKHSLRVLHCVSIYHHSTKCLLARCRFEKWIVFWLWKWLHTHLSPLFFPLFYSLFDFRNFMLSCAQNSQTRFNRISEYCTLTWNKKLSSIIVHLVFWTKKPAFYMLLLFILLNPFINIVGTERQLLWI